MRAAIVNSGRTWPNERIVLALSPATLRKDRQRLRPGACHSHASIFVRVPTRRDLLRISGPRGRRLGVDGRRPTAAARRTSRVGIVAVHTTTICARSASAGPDMRRCWPTCARGPRDAVHGLAYRPAAPSPEGAGGLDRPLPSRGVAVQTVRAGESTWAPRPGEWSPVSWARCTPRGRALDRTAARAKAQAAAAGVPRRPTTVRLRIRRRYRSPRRGGRSCRRLAPRAGGGVAELGRARPE